MTHIIYTTQALANTAMATLNTRFIALLEGDGLTKVSGGIVSKIDGVDAPSAQKTTGWDNARQYVEGWGFASPRGTQFDADADSLLEGLGGATINATNIPSEID